MELTFVTTNPAKFRIAETALAPYGIVLRQEAQETPEIQSLDVCEVATFSAAYMLEKLQRPLIVTDAGVGIQALNGFPGALLKFLNTLSAHDILNLMSAHINRTALMQECLAYAVPGQPIRTFLSEQPATLAWQAEGKGTHIEQLLIPEGHPHPLATRTAAEQATFWQTTHTHYRQFGNFLNPSR